MSPWSKVEESRRRVLSKVGRTFSYEQCAKCSRWFGDERVASEPAPKVCPYCREKPGLKERGEALAKARKAVTK